MEEGKRSCAHSHFTQSSSPFCAPFPAPCTPCSAAFADSNQCFIEEGGEVLVSEINGMILHFIRSAHAVPNFFRHRIR